MQQKGAGSAWPLGPDSDFSAVSLLLIGKVTKQMPSIWRLEARSIIKPSFTKSSLYARHWTKGFADIISFNFNSFKGPRR